MKEERKQQIILAGLEEIQRRRNLIYRIKNILNRNFGWFKKWADDVDAYYTKRYPLLNEDVE